MVQPGSVPHTQANEFQKRKVGQAPTMNQRPSLQGTNREQQEARKRNAIKGLKFNKNPVRKTSSAQRSSNHSSSSPNYPSSSSASIPALDGELGIARALNHAVTNNHRSSVNTDVVMHDIDEPITATEHTELAEGSTSNASVQSELRELREQVSGLSKLFSQAQGPLQVPAPPGLGYVCNDRLSLNKCLSSSQQNQLQPIFLCFPLVGRSIT
jgi:hypothetical protein